MMLLHPTFYAIIRMSRIFGALLRGVRLKMSLSFVPRCVDFPRLFFPDPGEGTLLILGMANFAL